MAGPIPGPAELQTARRRGERWFWSISGSRPRASPDVHIARALRLAIRATHSLVEGAGAAGLAGLLALGDRLAGQRVGIVLSGGNIDEQTLRRVVNGEL